MAVRAHLPTRFVNGKNARAALEALGGKIVGGSSRGRYYVVEFGPVWFVRLTSKEPVLVGHKGQRVTITHTPGPRLTIEGPISG